MLRPTAERRAREREGAAYRETLPGRPGPECGDGVVLDTLKAVGYGSP